MPAWYLQDPERGRWNQIRIRRVPRILKLGDTATATRYCPGFKPPCGTVLFFACDFPDRWSSLQGLHAKRLRRWSKAPRTACAATSVQTDPRRSTRRMSKPATAPEAFSRPSAGLLRPDLYRRASMTTGRVADRDPLPPGCYRRVVHPPQTVFSIGVGQVRNGSRLRSDSVEPDSRWSGRLLQATSQCAKVDCGRWSHGFSATGSPPRSCGINWDTPCEALEGAPVMAWSIRNRGFPSAPSWSVPHDGCVPPSGACPDGI